MPAPRPFHTLAVAILFALAATGCGTISPDSLAFVEETDRPGETVIRLATYSTAGIAAAIEQWEREHPTATVIVDRRGFDDHHSAILEPRTDQRAPDIIAFDVAYGHRFGDQAEMFADLRLLGGEEHRGQSLEWRWEQGIGTDGALIGIPIDLGGMAIAYRTDRVPTELAERLDSLSDWCDLLIVGDSYSDLTERPFLPQAADIFDAVLAQEPLRYHDVDGEPIHDSSPAVRHAWDMTMRSLGEAPLFEDPCPRAEGIDRFSANIVAGGEDWAEAIRGDGFAVVMASADTLGAIQTTAPATAGSWAVVPLPAGGGGNGSGMSLAVHADSPKPHLAYDLIAYLAAPPTQLRVFEQLGRFPAAVTLYEEPELAEHRRDFFGDSPIGSIYAGSATAYSSAPDGPDLRVFQREFRGAVSRVEAGHQTPQEAWDEALWRIVRVLD